MKYLFGASGHAKVVVEVIQSIKEVKLEGVFDDYKKLESFFQLPFLGKFSDFNKDLNPQILVSIGDNRIRNNIVKQLDVDFFTVIDNSAKVSKTSVIKEGCVIMPGVVINAQAKIGKHCIVNSASVIEHECIIGDFVHISPNVTITGNVTVGEGTHIGAGAVVIPNVTIGKWCKIGAGSVVINDVPDFSVAVGNPAKVIKINKI